MKCHVIGFGISALLHAALLLAAMPLLLWQDKRGLPEEQPVTLSLAQFQAAPPKPVALPPPPKPKPVEKPKPVKKPVAPPKPAPPPRPTPPAELPPEPAAIDAVAPTPPPAAPAPVAKNAAAEAAYRRKLENLIGSRKQYPRMAEKAEVEGTVTVSFTMLPDGTVTGARVSNSSGNEWLDKAAVQAVNAASGALPFPADIHKSQWDFSLKVNFKLDW